MSWTFFAFSGEQTSVHHLAVALARRAISPYLVLMITKKNVSLCDEIATKRIDRLLQNFVHRFFVTNSQSSSLMGEIALTISNWRPF